MAIDRRQIKVEFDHAQNRTQRARLGFTLTGFDFQKGVLDGTWINPITGKIQPIPNSEEPEFTTSNAGRFRKLQLSDVTMFDYNTPAGEFVAFGPDHDGQGIKYVGTNTAGVGVITTATQAINQGWTILAYCYDSGTDKHRYLIETFWANGATLGTGDVGFRISIDGKVEIFRDSMNNRVFLGSLSGSSYETFKTEKGGGYSSNVDEYVMVRIETDGRFIIITSSKGGVCQFEAPWAVDQYAPDGSIETPAQPALPAKKWGWQVREGSATVIAAPVVYGHPAPTAISETYRLAEIPTPTPDPGDDTVDVLSARIIPASDFVSGILLKPDGITPYNRDSRDFKVKLTFTGLAFVCGVVGSYPRVAILTPEPEGGPLDVSDYVEGAQTSLEDGNQGLSCELLIRGDLDEEFLEEAELRPIRVSYVSRPDSEDPPAPIVFLDGVGMAPEWSDGFEDAEKIVTIRVMDRMALIREAQVNETTPFDGVALCQPTADGESLMATAYREGGLRNFELVDLPRIENDDGSLFIISDLPGQKAGDWNFAAEVGDLWSDVQERGMAMAPEWIYGVRPTPDGLQAYVVKPDDSDPVAATFYRTPDSAAADPEYDENELGGWPLFYGRPHRRIKLPREANLVRVTGYSPGANKGLQAFASDDESRDPASALTADKLGVTRQFAYTDPALTTQAQVNELTAKIYKAISKRRYTHSWPAFLRFKADGSPVWRGDKIVLEKGEPDGSDSTIHVSGFSFDGRDESGAGLRDEEGNIPPVSVRIAEYSGGALVGLGGSSAYEIQRRQRHNVANGGMRRKGFGKIPSTSMSQVVRVDPA